MLFPFPVNQSGVNPTDQFPGYAAAESGTRFDALIHTLIRTTSPSLTPCSVEMSPGATLAEAADGVDAPESKYLRVPINPSCGVRENGRLNFSDDNPVWAASVVTTVFSKPLFSTPSLPPFGGNQ